MGFNSGFKGLKEFFFALPLLLMTFFPLSHFFFIFANMVPSLKGQWGTWSLISTGQNIDWEQHGTKFWGKYLYITKMKQQEHTEEYVMSSIIICCSRHMWGRWCMGRAGYVALKGGEKCSKIWIWIHEETNKRPNHRWVPNLLMKMCLEEWEWHKVVRVQYDVGTAWPIEAITFSSWRWKQRLSSKHKYPPVTPKCVTNHETATRSVKQDVCFVYVIKEEYVIDITARWTFVGRRCWSLPLHTLTTEHSETQNKS